MKTIAHLIFNMLVGSFNFCNAQYVIPDVGSHWERQTRYINSDSYGKMDSMKVAKIENGVPIFSVSLGGYDGVLFQSGENVVGVVGGCSSVHVAGGQLPNVCGWTPCSIGVGQIIHRKFIAVTPLSSCAPVEGVIEHIGTERTEISVSGQRYSAIKTPSVLKVSSIGSVKWTAFIADKLGEVHAESPGRETLYHKVAVKLVSSIAPTTHAATANVVIENKAALKRNEILGRSHLEKPLIVALGDSLTLGMGVAASQTYPAILQQLMPGFEVLKLGIAGTTVDELSDSVATLKQLKPALILLNVGGNDMLRGLAREELRSKLTELTSLLKGLTEQVVLLGLEIDDLTPYRGLFFEVAREAEVEFLPNLLAGVYKNAPMLTSDGLHPNPNGYSQMAHNVANWLVDSWFRASRLAMRK